MFRPIAITVFSVLSLVAIALIRELVSSHDPILVVFMVLWLAALVWNGYWFLFRIAFEICVVDGSTLRWRTMTSSYEARLDRMTGVMSPWGRFGNTLRRIAVEGGPSPLLIPAPGISDVIAAVVAFRPEVPVKSSWLDRSAERFAGRSVYWRKVDGGGRPA